MNPTSRDRSHPGEVARHAALASVNAVTATPAMDLASAARLMLEHRIGGLPVVEGGTLVGIITESDIFRRFVESQEGV